MTEARDPELENALPKDAERVQAESRRARPGLRLQILLALAGVILVAYVPLFFAIAQVSRASALSRRDEAARAIGRAVAAHVGDAAARGRSEEELARVVSSHVGAGGALAVTVFDAQGSARVRGGDDAAAMTPPSRPYGESVARAKRTDGGRALDVTMPMAGGAVVVRVDTDEDPARTSGFVRGVALYMTVFALALLVFAYIVLTRAIVRPIERLGRAADRVASGARSLEVPSAGAREIADLSASVRAMAARLRGDEEALRAKIDELGKTTRHLGETREQLGETREQLGETREQLGETREQLAGSERMASVGRLAAGVAHEIGNPIAAIMGMHDLLAEGDLPEEDRVDFLRRMRKETERVNVVVRDLLDYARPEDAPASSSAAANVAEIVGDAIALVRPQRDWKGLEVNVDAPSDLEVKLSPQRLTQVMLNLLLNAAAALSDGAPTTSARRVDVRAARQGAAHVRITIEDTGPGIPEAMHARIFDPFVTTKDVGAGTGLGLSVCRGIVEGAAGRIWIDTTYTSGARFVVELPSSPGP